MMLGHFLIQRLGTLVMCPGTRAEGGASDYHSDRANGA